MSESSISWREAGRVFILSRLLLFGVTCICIFLLPLWIPGYVKFSSPDIYHILPSEMANQIFFSWLRWDVKPFLNISGLGYRYLPDTAFFPLWPLLQHLGGLALGGRFPGSFYLAGILLSNLFFYLALVILYRLVAKGFGPSLAKRTLFYFTFSPFAIFFFAGYSESLFTFLCLGVFLALQRGKAIDWWLAGLLGLLAAFTRSLGLLLAVPFLVVYLQRFWWGRQAFEKSTWKARINGLLPITLIPFGLFLYMLYLYFTRGNLLLFNVEEAAIWHRETMFPLWTLVITIQAFFQESLPVLQIENLANLIVVLLFFAALFKGWKALPLHYTLFALSMEVLALSVPMMIPQDEPLLSQPRFVMILFPLAIIFALWGKDRRVDLCLRVAMVLLFALTAGMFVSNVWVA